MWGGLPFAAVWVPDFEYHQPDGGLPDPLCVVAVELISGTRVARWLGVGEPAPYDTGPNSLFIAHNAASEVGCHLALNWPLPAYVFDTYATYRALKNGFDMDRSASLLAACSRYGIPTISSAAKARGRDIAIQVGNTPNSTRRSCSTIAAPMWTPTLNCSGRCCPRFSRGIRDLPHALIFGEYMKAIAAVERAGVPINAALLERLQRAWPQLRARLIRSRDTRTTDCYLDGHFNKKRFEALLRSLGQLETWPRTETGQVSLENDTFRRRAHSHPLLKSLYELHYTLDKLKSLTLHVGSDRRHRAIGRLDDNRSAGQYPFGTKTGRNAPKGSVFAPAVWVRHLLQPGPGTCLVYSDYSAEEVHIAARMSGDPAMMAAVMSRTRTLGTLKQLGWHRLKRRRRPTRLNARRCGSQVFCLNFTAQRQWGCRLALICRGIRPSIN